VLKDLSCSINSVLTDNIDRKPVNNGWIGWQHPSIFCISEVDARVHRSHSWLFIYIITLVQMARIVWIVWMTKNLHTVIIPPLDDASVSFP
jgi:hypothetical protein